MVPTDWTTYEVSDDLVVYLNSAVQILPPYIVLESLVLAGKAKRIGGEAIREGEPEGSETSPWFMQEDGQEGEDGDKGD